MIDMSKRQCYRALVMRVTEVQIEIWADSYEEAVIAALDNGDENNEVETRVHEDQLVDVVPFDQEFAC